MSLEEAQDLIMTARVALGWIDPEDAIAHSDDTDQNEEE